MKLTHFDHNMRHVPTPGSQTVPQPQTINIFQSTKAGELGALCKCPLLILPKQEDCARRVFEVIILSTLEHGLCGCFFAGVGGREQLCLLFWFVCLSHLAVSQRLRILRVVPLIGLLETNTNVLYSKIHGKYCDPRFPSNEIN